MFEGQLIRPVWAEVDLDGIAHNMREVKRLVEKDVQAMAVIKADGYGHGALEIAGVLLENGANQFAVATLSEALALREKYKDVPILVLGYCASEHYEIALRHDLMVTVFSFAQGLALSQTAQLIGKKAGIHLKIDTGMSRLGFQVHEESVAHIFSISELEGIEIKGIFTHFAKADEIDKSFTHEQMKRYFWLLKELEARKVAYGLRHVCNSAGIIDLPEYHLDMVRAGIMLYGLYPSQEVHKERVHLKEAMQLKAKIAQVKEVAAGDGVSYGHRFVAATQTKVATLPIGYADGFTRLLSLKAKVLFKGKFVPVIGTICMDQCMIDVSGMEAERNDEVVLFGKSGDAFYGIDAYAKLLGTINYEVVCMMGKRIPRVYFKNNEIINVIDFNLRHDFF